MHTRLYTICILGALMYRPVDSRVVTKVEHHTHYVKQTNGKITEQKLKQEIERLNLRHGDIIYAQAVLESANFTSSLFKKNNNFLGLKVARQRPTTALRSVGGYAYYSSWRECLLDYALMNAKYMSRLSREEYLDYLQENYAEDKNYIKKLYDTGRIKTTN